MIFTIYFFHPDLPSILSGDRLGMIDPHQKYFNAATFGWSLKNQPELNQSLSGHTRPYCGKFNCTNSNFTQANYPGTIFRFPLRTAPSALSTSIYTSDKVNALFDTFKQNGHLVLLFLMHLESIELYEQEEKQNEPHLLYQVKILEECLEDVREKRVKFLNKAKAGSWPDQPVVCSYRILFKASTWTNDSHRPTCSVFSYLVTNYFCGGHFSSTFRQLYNDSDLRYPPWVSTALPLEDVIDTNKCDEQNGEQQDTKEGKGLAFCFLPLEELLSTGLPIHVNGFFALEQNRKQLKWPSSLMHQNLLDKRAQWNQCLLKEALPKAYAQLIVAAIKLHKSGLDLSVSDIYKAFPDMNQIERRWQVMLMPTYGELLKHPVIYTKSGGGSWLLNRDAVYNTLDVNPETSDMVLDVMSHSTANIASIPPYILQAIRTCCPFNLTKITAQNIASTYKEVQYNSSFSRDQKLALLLYLLDQNKYDLLEGLELLPTADGCMDVFVVNPRRAQHLIYIASDKHPMSLLPGMERRFLDDQIDSDLSSRLTRASSRGKTCCDASTDVRKLI